jgi:transcriptional regulator with XRE-family HTH domain
MPRSKRPEPDLPPGPARDLVDLFRRLRNSSQLRIGQIARRAGYAPGHVSEVLRGWKAPSPDAAARIAQALGTDDNTVRRARRRPEDLRDWKRVNSRNRPSPGPPREVAEYPGPRVLEIELARAIVHYAMVDGRSDIAGQLLDILGVAAVSEATRLPVHHTFGSLDVTLNIVEGNLFDQDTHIAIGFSDTFDTSILDDRVIRSSSVQGQLLRRVYHDDQRQLDEQLDAALASVSPERTESRRDKPYGSWSATRWARSPCSASHVA